MAAETTFQVAGMDCSHCAQRLGSALEHLEGVIKVEVDPAGTATVRYDEVRLSLRDLAERVRDAGFDTGYDVEEATRRVSATLAAAGGESAPSVNEPSTRSPDQPARGGYRELRLQVTMHCEHCAQHLQDRLGAMDAVRGVQTDHDRELVTIRHTSRVSEEQIRSKLDQMGFDVTAYPNGDQEDAQDGGEEDEEGTHPQAERLLRLLAAATFLIFFQIFMVAPLIPRLAEVFRASTDFVGLAVPAYLIPYGIATLVWGPLSDRLGRGPVIMGSMVAFIVLTALTALAITPGLFILIRLITAIGASGVIPISLTLMGDLFAYGRRGRPLGWLFGAMAGGMAFGSSLGALLEPFVAWQGLFVGVAGVTVPLMLVLLRYRGAMQGDPPADPPAPGKVARGFLSLLQGERGRRTYAYVLINGIVYSGIYTWLGLYFVQRHRLGQIGIGLAILGYGFPGMVLGPGIGRLVDRFGRARLIPLGVTVGAVSALLLAPPLPLLLAALAVAILSLGYDLTQPLLAGIVTDLSAPRGLAMGLNVFTLFVGFGLGSLIFQALLPAGFGTALVVFGAATLLAAGLAIPAFREETHAAT